jgi:predicted CxxxxCH...CXXCH cytochrome family protein
MRALFLIVLACSACTTAEPVEGRRDVRGVHEPGILDPASDEFHGKLLADRKYDFGFCAKCHGEDFSGGKAQSSCLTCHASAPTSCTTCHGTPPKSGAHEAHVSAGMGCETCHTKPASWSDVGHILLADGEVDPAPAEVRLDRGGFASGACSNTYCHGPATPSWNGGPAAAACGTCHAIPPANHPPGACASCHGRVVDADARIINRALHADGKVSLGDDGGTCLSCHPKPGGAHESHIDAKHQISARIACSECHRVPAQVTSPGHLSGRAEVFPAGGAGPIATAGGAMPSWDGARCSDTHCHGRASAPLSWVPSPAGFACGTCHGVPPQNVTHTGATLATCYMCHGAAIDASARLLPAHINGVVDGP